MATDAEVSVVRSMCSGFLLEDDGATIIHNY